VFKITGVFIRVIKVIGSFLAIVGGVIGLLTAGRKREGIAIVGNDVNATIPCLGQSIYWIRVRLDSVVA
jgi:hypothetical protein